MSALARWRDFRNRREPGALWMLGLLVPAAAVQIALSAWGPLALTLAALVAGRWWSLPAAPAFSDPKWEVPPGARRWVTLMAAALAILAMWPRSERLNHSLSEAELRDCEVARAFGREDPAPLSDDTIAPVGRRRLVEERVIAQFAGDRWPFSNGWPGDGAVPPDARGLRTLPWLAGVLTISLIVLLGAALGSPRAGLAAGLMLAMHPGHVRWSAELSDQAHTLFCFSAAFYSLLCALRTNRWRWWTALAVCQAGMLLGHPSALLQVAALNVVAAVILIRPPARDRLSAMLRLVVALAVAGTVVALPSHKVITGDMDVSPLLDGRWRQLFTGTEDSGFMDPWREALLWLLPLSALAGFSFMLRQDWRTRLFAGVAAVALLSGPAITVLPLLLAWAGAGLIRLFPSQPRLLHAPLFIAVLYVAVTMPVLQRMIKLPIQSLREAAATARMKAGDNGTTAVLGQYAEAIPSDDPSVHRLKTSAHHAGYAKQYDPRVQVVAIASTLETLVDEAFEKERPLFVYRTGAIAADPGWSALNDKLEKSGQFHLVAEFPAFDPALSYKLYRYQPKEQIIHLEVKPEKK